ncbi:hypothetical protein BFC22_10705 [Carnobacterium divergens]|uniref:hypothetical protein n=1 Tax=Carnobacterium divergens TaxID=2748 RepID=UPI000E712E58|nr:hypothetical protein [Carnobacterium divergens]AOA00529.1 hypothetical protein BFC22_10705 [Carnobacterium divergens]
MFKKLYEIQEEMLNKILEHDLFSLAKEDALFLLVKKIGNFNSFMPLMSEEQLLKFLKGLINTNSKDIELIRFLQESLKWLSRWVGEHCPDLSSLNSDNSEIKMDDVLELMGKAYEYEIFYNLCKLNSNNIMKASIKKNRISFNFRNEETYKYHLGFDNIWRRLVDDNLNHELLNRFGKLNHSNIKNISNEIHQSNYEITFNLSFIGFNLNEYRLFSKVMNEILLENQMKNMNGNTRIIIGNETDYLRYEKTEWISILAKKTSLTRETIESITTFFTFDYSEKNNDLSLTYFLPYYDQLIVSLPLFMMLPPEWNAVRLLAKRRVKSYAYEQNLFEEEQKEKIENFLSDNNRYLFSGGYDRKSSLRSGMDLLVYDKFSKILQVIELKYKIPVESTQDIINLEETYDTAYKQLEKAQEYVTLNKETILHEYFGSRLSGVIPEKIDYFVLTNYSIGIGSNVQVPSPILLIEYYLQAMAKLGPSLVSKLLQLKDKGLNYEIVKQFTTIKILDYKIVYPDYLYRIKEGEL